MLPDQMMEATNRATDVYHDHIDFSTCRFQIHTDQTRKLYFVTFKGTDPTWKDWFRNFNLTSKGGFKKHAWNASEEVYRYIVNIGDLGLFDKYKKVIQGHSQGGPEAGTFYEKFCTPDDKLFMYDPPPYRKGMVELGNNAYIIVNDKSIVRNLGFICFNLPGCNWWYFDAFGKLHTDLNWKEMRQLGRINKGSFSELWSDHPMPIFQKLIKKLDGVV